MRGGRRQGREGVSWHAGAGRRQVVRGGREVPGHAGAAGGQQKRPPAAGAGARPAKRGARKCVVFYNWCEEFKHHVHCSRRGEDRATENACEMMTNEMHACLLKVHEVSGRRHMTGAEEATFPVCGARQTGILESYRFPSAL